MVDALTFTTCAASTDAVLVLYLLPLIAFFFIILAMIVRVGALGFFGSVLLFISAWFLSPCSAIFAFLVALFGLIMLMWFSVTGLSFGSGGDDGA